jgi:hypothetical protein
VRFARGVAHVLWEPRGPERGRIRPSKHDGMSGVGVDYCGLREPAFDSVQPAPHDGVTAR